MSVLRHVNLHWSYLDSVKCVKYSKLDHILLGCSVDEKISSGGLFYKLNDKFAAFEHSFVSLVKRVNKLAKRLNTSGPAVSQLSLRHQSLVTPSSQNQEVDIVISEGSNMVTSSKIIAEVVVSDFSVMTKLENTVNSLLITVMSLLAKIDNAGLAPISLINFSSFVVLGGNFNKSRSKKNTSFGFCLGLGLVNFFVFDTDHKAVLVLVSLNSLLDKFRLKDINISEWKCFIECSSGKFLRKSVEFYVVEYSEILKEVIVNFANKIFFRLWFSEFNCTINKLSSKFHRLKLLMFKIVNNVNSGLSLETDYLVCTWVNVDEKKTCKVYLIINRSAKVEDILHHILVVKKSYSKSKYHESKIAKDNFIKKAVKKHMENICLDKERMIKSILNQSFKKMVFNYLIVNNELILEPQAVKFSIDTIIEGWTRKHLVFSTLVMYNVNMNELLWVVKNLSDEKAARLSGISNEL
ncbi:hypothetical protein G9A89_018152 [Geosiphon pyriformis]|nr:hypothetical protein G9A89_018152 [Geosiphon pyriformis]